MTKLVFKNSIFSVTSAKSTATGRAVVCQVPEQCFRLVIHWTRRDMTRLTSRPNGLGSMAKFTASTLASCPRLSYPILNWSSRCSSRTSSTLPIVATSTRSIPFGIQTYSSLIRRNGNDTERSPRQPFQPANFET